jgi:hypothetical protein
MSDESYPHFTLILGMASFESSVMILTGIWITASII